MVKPMRVDRTNNGLKMLSRNSNEKRVTDKSLLHVIKNLAAKGALLKEVNLEVEQLESSGSGKDEEVFLVFRVPSESVETQDPDTGVIRVSSEGSRFSYTFSGRLTLQKNLRDFDRFYRKRSVAVVLPLPSREVLSNVAGVAPTAFKTRA